MSADVQSPPQPKYTRYRSVRRTITTEPKPPVNPPRQTEDPNDILQRSRSRYHRVPRTASFLEQNPVPNVPAIPQATQRLSSIQSSQNGALTLLSNDSEEQKLARAKTVARERRQQREEQRQSMKVEPCTISTSGVGRAEIVKSDDVPERGRPQQIEYLALRDDQLQDQEQVAKKLAEQKRKDLERLQAELAAAAALSSPPERPSSTTGRTGVERFSLFGRKRAKSKVTSPRPSGSDDANTEARSQEFAKIKSNEAPRDILQGGGGAVPGVDAPKSAVNAGERRVLIRCKQSSINLPITPETTPVDLLYSAANILSPAMAPSTSIILEAYTQLGLERRIRRYEHIRDIMNSWDRDTQNALLIQPSDSPNHDFDLEEGSVPREQPKDVTVYMYHSQKPGKWSKRYITLLSTGQIFTSKKKDAKATDKDNTTICHLTDFDIYTPTSQQLRTNLRPPKKYCYAVKSQQKTAMFLDTEKFVHFFSSDDYNMATKWYDACQQWRSWYLVHMMGEGEKESVVKKKVIKVSDVRMALGQKVLGHKVQVSVNEDPYTIGSFSPLIDLARFEKIADQDEDDEMSPCQVPFHLRNGSPNLEPQTRRYPPPVSYKRGLGNEPADSAFAPTSLLGRTYSQRQRAQQERDQTFDANGGPFIPGSSLLNSDRPKTGVAGDRTSQIRQRAPSIATRRPTTAGVHRSGTQKAPPTPLIDLTPKFQEAPQWSKEGKGRGVVPPSGVPLVEVATGPQGPEVNHPLPVLFRRDG